MKVSIIIPIYNGNRFIYNLYQLLKAQTFEDYELLFINDGSTDDSLDYLYNLQLNDTKVKVINKKNGGICSARNLGLKNAKGEYIIFLDQDDEIEIDLIEKYVEAIELSKADMAVFGKMHYYVQDGCVIKKEIQTFKEELVTDKITIYNYIFNVDNKKRLMTIWNCIYRKDFIDRKKISFDENFKYGDEDGLFNFKYAMECTSIYFSSSWYYHYYIRKGLSTSTVYNNELVKDFLYFIDIIRMDTIKLCEDKYLARLIELYILRFFSNKYKRYAEFHKRNKDRLGFLKEISKNETMQLAFRFNNKGYSNIFGKKYYYWNIVNLFMKHNMYYLAMKMLDILVWMK